MRGKNKNQQIWTKKNNKIFLTLESREFAPYKKQL